ncbi:glycosyltransferase family protein [Amycolatopsis aidingensis]|uniref:glycosyltransferase family protein n=1 Tax=Amycolatopsis aidingensis TaxID=2842453 RepID=UPI001C0C65A4|nr:glycosyltransferase [Amycolatopsis aidingensis]
MSREADLCLVSAEGGSAFMAELLEVVADAVRAVGGQARTATGRFPEPGPNTVYVVVPHEYFVVTPDEQLPAADLCRRTIGFCVENPGTDTFERNAALVRSLAAAVDINREATAELGRRGIQAEYFQLGYSPRWDSWGGDLDAVRDIDVTYLGTAQRRRSLLLGSYWPDLQDLRVRLLTPPHEMMTAKRPDFLPGTEKLAHLARSRFLLNVHREQARTLEWVRTLEAMSNGCVVVTEPCLNLEPLVPGRHLVVSRPESLGSAVAALCAQPERERQLRAAAYEFVRGLDLPGSARMLTALASSLLTGPQSPPPDLTEARRLAGALRSPAQALAIDTPSVDVRFGGEPTLPEPEAPVHPMSTAEAVRLAQRTVAARRTSGRCWVESSGAELFPEVQRVDADVLVVRRPGEPDPDELVRDLLCGTVLPGQILVAEDGVVPHQVSRPYRMLRHELPLGRGYARNALAEASTAPRLLVLDAGMRAAKHLLERLLQHGPEEGVAHCPVADPVAGLVGALPPERRRLDRLPYLGSGYLVHRSVLDAVGGWTEDPLLDGLEDHVFWRQVAAGGQQSTLVQQVLLQRMRPDPAPRPLDLDPRKAWAAANLAGA